MSSNSDIIQLSKDLLLAVKLGNDYQTYVKEFSSLSWKVLTSLLPHDSEKKAFWINCYNAYFLILRKDHNLEKPNIYTDKAISIGKTPLSLDDIEHGILRKYRYKWTLGYFRNPFAKGHIKKASVETIDYRIHFALNCGAKSCPPIAFYDADQIDAQLELATQSFLENETFIDHEEKKVTVSRLFLWHAGDFGGKRGARAILEKYLHFKTSNYKITYGKYDWSEDLDNFV